MLGCCIPPFPLSLEPAGAKKSKTASKNAAKTASKDAAKQSGSGWGFNLMKYIMPKKKNEAHLPDDSKPSVCQAEGEGRRRCNLQL